MRKLITSLLGISMLVTACNKQDLKAPTEELVLEETPVISQRKCAANDVLAEQLAADPSMRTRMEQIELYTQKVMSNPAQYRLVNGVIEIPVVVHVVYNTAAQNIPDAQIASQIAVLNEDFKNQNADRSKLPANSFQSVVSPGVNVNFVLDQTKRVSTKTRSWSTSDAVKKSNRGGSNPIDPATKLNIWVCNLGQGLLGYAQFPGGPLATDGVVVLYSAFGSKAKYAAGSYSTPYDLGRTTTHEVGHYLNLRHIWGDDGTGCTGSDLVADTPNQGDENYGVPTYPTLSCNNGSTGDMFMNYMDYTDDRGMYMFTALQKSRMEALFTSTGARAAMGK